MDLWLNIQKEPKKVEIQMILLQGKTFFSVFDHFLSALKPILLCGAGGGEATPNIANIGGFRDVPLYRVYQKSFRLLNLNMFRSTKINEVFSETL